MAQHKVEAVKIDTDKQMSDFIQAIERKGYRKAGAGAFGVVYYHPDKDRVWKLGRLEENAGYLMYIEAVSKHQRNPFFPKVYHIRKYKSSSGRNFFAVRLERLSDLEERNYKMGDMFEALAGGRPNALEKVTQLKKDKKLGATSVNKYYVAQVGKIIRHLLDNKHRRADFHLGNVMWRVTPAGKELVVTDPVV